VRPSPRSRSSLRPSLLSGRRWLSTATVVAGALLLAVCRVGSALALANTETEEQRIGRALQAALEKHGGDVNRCFERALADTLDVSGKVELAVDIGAGGRVTRAVPLEHTADSPVLLTCLSTSALDWVIPGLADGSTVIVPLAFEGQMAQFSVKTADAPERGPAAATAKGKPRGKTARGSRGKMDGASKASPAFSVKVLVDEATMRARQASLSLLTLSPASRIAMHKHPGAELLYIKKGRARVLGPAGVPPEVLVEGTAIFIPAGMPHVIENMVRSSAVEILQVFAPLGPERVYRDPTDEKGRAAFEVIRDGRAATRPPGARFIVETFDKATVHPEGPKVRVHVMFDPANSKSDAASMSLLELEPGAEIARHSHASAAEILYILSGAGHIDIGSDKLAFGPEQAIHLPENQPHTIRTSGAQKTVALQIFAPAGAEPRSTEGAASGAASEPPRPNPTP
jgi:quercetin dioxygenase-like cupin family protein